MVVQSAATALALTIVRLVTLRASLATSADQSACYNHPAHRIAHAIVWG